MILVNFGISKRPYQGKLAILIRIPDLKLFFENSGFYPPGIRFLAYVVTLLHTVHSEPQNFVWHHFYYQKVSLIKKVTLEAYQKGQYIASLCYGFF